MPVRRVWGESLRDRDADQLSVLTVQYAPYRQEIAPHPHLGRSGCWLLDTIHQD